MHENLTTENTTIVCPHVFRHERPVKLVIHHEDGLWQMVCGAADHCPDCSDFEVVGIEHLLERQKNLGIVEKIPLGGLAEWESEFWTISKFEENP